MNKNTNYRLKIFIFSLALLSLSSCMTNEKIAYFKDLEQIKQATLDSAAAFVEPVIQTDDILSINIFTLDPQTGVIVNQAAATPTLGGNTNTSVSTQSTGFLVDKNGEIELSMVGKIKVSGLTTYQAREFIRQRVSKDYIKPNIQLRFANFKISVIGEVNNPSAYTLPNEKVSILDALSLAGDLTIYGKRENVMVIRDNGGRKEIGRLDLNSSEIFSSPYYYLKQNDVIYVEPNKRKVSASNSAQIQTFGVIASLLTVIVLAISSFK